MERSGQRRGDRTSLCRDRGPAARRGHSPVLPSAQRLSFPAPDRATRGRGHRGPGEIVLRSKGNFFYYFIYFGIGWGVLFIFPLLSVLFGKSLSRHLQSPVTQQAGEGEGGKGGLWSILRAQSHIPPSAWSGHAHTVAYNSSCCIDFVFSLLGFVFLHLTENAGAIGHMVHEECSVLSTVYGSNTFFGRDLFLFGLNVIKEPQLKGTFCHEHLILVYPPPVKQLSTAA